ncbi:MAG: FitA-like ribbon-helix-helix domain-containing protein [Pseudomonadota bacterium]
MTQVLVRNLSDHVMARLKKRAWRHGKPLEAELRSILMAAAPSERGDLARRAAEMRLRLAGRRHGDSAELLRRDRAPDQRAD